MEPTPVRLSPSAPRSRLLRWGPVPAVLCAVLTGCTTPAPPGPAGPGATPPSSTALSASQSLAGTPSATPHGPWGSYESQEQACAGVAADVVTLSLLSTSLPVSRRVEDLQQVEDEVEAMRRAAPPAVASHYARIQLAVDTYGEDLATPAPTSGSGPGQEPRVDDQALEEALEQIRTWLTDTCQDRR